MDKAKLGKILLSVGGMALMVVSNIVNTKVQDDKMKDTIAAQVKEELANQAKES